MNTRKIILALMLTMAGFAFAASAVASDIKIGAVNMAKLLHDSPQAKVASDDMQKKFESRREDLLSEQKKMKALQDDIDKNGSVMSAGQLQNKQDKLEQMKRDFNQKQSDYMDDVSTQRNEELGKLQHDIVLAVQEFAKKNGYNLVVGQGVFYADGTVDVTDKVLGQLQKDFNAGSEKSKH